jgi:NADP-dependent 3-hydroxy acid dehydrogenase YdfG
MTMSKSIMIIGAGPGIGQAVARKFGSEGWRIALAGRNPARVDKLTADLTAQGYQATGIAVDATDPVALRAAIAEADRAVDGLTTILFNAAVVRQQDLFSMTDDEIVSDLAINIAGGLHTIRAAVAHFEGRSGTILVTGGGLGVTPHADYASLGLGKAALRNVVAGLASPLAERSIRIGLATVAAAIAPASPEAKDVANLFWALATDADAGWEAVYPPA